MTIVERLRGSGIQRTGSPGRGFRYRCADGGHVSRADRDRIDALRIPPAWTAVAIHPSPRSRVQAAGLDAAGRWQYLYHRAHVARRERNKQRRLARFLEAVPRMRRAVRRDLALPGLPRDKVLAGILTILSTCFMRPGSEQYASQNGSYGIATLGRRHVSTRGEFVRFDFMGKSRQRQQRELRHRRLARLVRELARYPGEVFKFRDESGLMVDIRTPHINAYIKGVMGEAFSAKDFRTWAANLLCACALAKTAPAESPRERRRQITAAVRDVAGHLGNTPSVCRASYIFDVLIERHQAGLPIRSYCASPEAIARGSARGLARSERALLALVRPGAAAAA